MDSTICHTSKCEISKKKGQTKFHFPILRHHQFDVQPHERASPIDQRDAQSGTPPPLGLELQRGSIQARPNALEFPNRLKIKKPSIVDS